MNRVVLCLVISFFTLSATGFEACKKRYEYAKEQCTKTKAVCLQSKLCKKIRTKCSQNISRMEGCESFSQCMVSNSPNFFSSTCRYEWNGLPDGGKCLNKNMEHEKVASICPGKQPSLTPYQDEDFICQSQVSKLEESQKNCRRWIVNYHRKCMADISRKLLDVPECPGGDKPLSKTTESIVSGNKNEVNVSRSASRRRTIKKKTQREKDLEALNSKAFGK